MERTYKKIDMDTVISMIKDHHLWLSSGGKEGKQAVFTGYDLSGLDSDYAEARYVVPPFWEKNLSKIDLSYSNLSGLSFRKVILSQADFRGANLKNAHFYQATLYKADFSGADISEAYIEESSLNQANLTKTDLSKTRIAYSHLEDANLQDANCRETNFQRAQLRGANLHGADFYGARFVATTIEENQFIHIRFPESIESPCWDTGLVSLQAQALESENKIRQLEHELELTDKENKAEVKKLQDQLQYERVKSQQISELGLNKRIEDAQKALAFIQPDVSLVVNIKESVDAMERAVEATGTDISDFNKGNIKARSRMIAQYALAGARSGAVIGTDHAAENITGFFTKFGDGGADILPLFRLNKRQGKQLLKTLGADPALYEKIPTADLEEEKPGVADEVALGVTYNEIDDYLEGKQVSPEAQATIEKWWYKGQHKRHLPITVFDHFWE